MRVQILIFASKYKNILTGLSTHLLIFFYLSDPKGIYISKLKNIYFLFSLVAFTLHVQTKLPSVFEHVLASKVLCPVQSSPTETVCDCIVRGGGVADL